MSTQIRAGLGTNMDDLWSGCLMFALLEEKAKITLCTTTYTLAAKNQSW